MRRKIIIIIFALLMVAGIAKAGEIVLIGVYYPATGDLWEDKLYERNEFQNPIGNGWTVAYSEALPGSAAIATFNDAGDKAWKISNMPAAGIGYTFDSAEGSNETEVLALMRRDNVLTSGLIVRLDGGDGYAVTFGGETIFAFFEIVDEVAYWLAPTDEPHGISPILGEWVWIRAGMHDTALSVKAWAYGDPEPAGWTAQRIIVMPVVSSGTTGILHMGATGANSTYYMYFATAIDGVELPVPDITIIEDEEPPPPVYTEAHYVTQGGAGSYTGRSPGNAWSLSNFNNIANWSTSKAADSKIGPNDVVYFSGTITTRLDLKGSGTSGNPITLDGYESGNCNPIANGSCPGATVTGGLEQSQINHYLTFQDFNITTTNWQYYRRGGASTNLKWLRNNFDNFNAHMLAVTSFWEGASGSYWWFEGNRFGNYALTSNPPGGINFCTVNNLVIRGNYFTGHNGVALSSNVLEFHHCTEVLVEYNHTDSVINQGNTAPWAFKEPWNYNVIVRFNKFRTREERALGVAPWPSSGFFVYGNYFYQDTWSYKVNYKYVLTPSGPPNAAYGMDIFDGAANVNVWSNIFANHTHAGLMLWWASGRGFDDKRIQNIKIYNNTFYNNAINGGNWLDQTGLSIGDAGATGIIVKNNIFSNNRPTTSDRRQINNQIGSNLTLEHNTYFHSGGAPVVWHFSADRTIPVLQSSYQREDDSPTGVVVNPGLNTNMTLNGTHINNGANLSGLAGSLTIHGTAYNMYWQTALHPSTDWSGQPSASKIITADQGVHGSGWERGAYVYQQ